MSPLREPVTKFDKEPITRFDSNREPVTRFDETVQLETNDESFPVTILKSLAQGARFLPWAAASALKIAGVEGPFEELKSTEKFVTPQTTDPIQRKIGEAVTGVAQTAGLAAVSTITGGGILPLLGVSAGTTETARLLDQGQPLDRAILDGVITGTLEAATEKIPFDQFGKLIKGGVKGPLKTLIKGITADIAGEVINDLTKQGLVDPLILDRDFPSFDKLSDTAADTASTALLAAIMLGGGATALGKFGDTKLNIPLLDKVSKTKKLSGPISMEELKSLPEKEALDPVTQQEMDARASLQTAEQVIKATKLEEIDPIMQEVREASKTEYPELNLQEVIEPSRSEQLTPEIKRTQQEALALPVPEPVITPSEEAFFDDKVTKSMQKSTETAIENEKFTAEKIHKALVKNTLDRQGTIKKTLDDLANVTKDPNAIKAKENLVLRAGSSSLSDFEFAKIEKEIIKGMDKNDVDYLNSLIQSKRSIEIARNKPGFKFQEGLTVKDFENNIRKIPIDKLDAVVSRAKKYWAKMDNILQELVDEGIQTQGEKDRTSAKGQFYSPRAVLEYLDGPEGSYLQQGRKISVPDSGIQKLSDEGSLKLIESDAMFLMRQAIARKNSRIFNNRANVPMYEFAVQNPENGVVKEVPIIRTKKNGEPVFADVPTGWQKFAVKVEGETKQFALPNEIAGEWVTSDPIINKTLGNILHYLSGSFLLKPMATGLSVGFAFAQIPKDSTHIFFSTEEYSPHAPVAMLQMGQDLAETFEDAGLRKGLYEDYLKNGGGMEFLTNQGRVTSKVSGAIKDFQELAGYLGETTEIWTRLALMNRALKNGKSPREAAYVARTYLDFHQGGDFTKLLDKGVPYLNASVQGTRGIGRAFKTNPKTALYKTSQIMATAGIIYSLWNASNDEDKDFYRDIPQRDIDNNWLIPLPITITDDQGNKRKPYFKIPLDQGQRLFSAIGRNLTSKAIDDKWDSEDIKQNVINSIPILPTEVMSPSVEAALGFSANKNFWRNEDIWKGPDVRSDLEKTPYTPDVFVDVGKLTGTSPVRLQYATKQLFTSGNVWTALAMYPLKKILNELPENQKEEASKSIWEKLSRMPISKKFIGLTNPVERQLKERKEALQQENSRKRDLQDNFDKVKRGFRMGEIAPDQATQFLLTQNPIDQKMLIDREKKIRKLEDLRVPNPSFWIGMQGLSPEVKARIIFSEWVGASEDNKLQIEKAAVELSSKKLFGLSSDRLVKELNLLIKKRNDQLRKTE